MIEVMLSGNAEGVVTQKGLKEISPKSIDTGPKSIDLCIETIHLYEDNIYACLIDLKNSCIYFNGNYKLTVSPKRATLYIGGKDDRRIYR